MWVPFSDGTCIGREGLGAGEAHPCMCVWGRAQKYQLLVYDAQLLHSESVLQGMSASSASTENKKVVFFK